MDIWCRIWWLSVQCNWFMKYHSTHWLMVYVWWKPCCSESRFVKNTEDCLLSLSLSLCICTIFQLNDTLTGMHVQNQYKLMNTKIKFITWCWWQSLSVPKIYVKPLLSDFYQLKTIRPLDPTCEPLNYRTIAENLNDRQAFSSGIEFGAENQ